MNRKIVDNLVVAILSGLLLLINAWINNIFKTDLFQTWISFIGLSSYFLLKGNFVEKTKSYVLRLLLAIPIALIALNGPSLLWVAILTAILTYIVMVSGDFKLYENVSITFLICSLIFATNGNYLMVISSLVTGYMMAALIVKINSRK